MESSLKLLVLLSCLGASAQLCEIPPANSNLVVRVTQKLLGWIDQQAPLELNPSIYVGLRLSKQPSQEQDDFYLNSLMIHYQQSFSSLALEHQPKPSMGQLALYLLAVRGGCRDIDTRKGSMLVTQLKHHLEEEKHRIGHNHEGYPLTSYYQYSLSILALCIHNKKVPGHVVEKLLHAAEHNLFLHGHQFSVDTAAMASLTFSCLKDSGLNPGLASRISSASKHLRNKILEEETPEGYFGNIYSSPLALQALMAAPSPESELACLRVGGALLKGLQAGAFENPIPLSQLLPVLHHKTYLDLIQLDCNDERVLGPLEEDATTPQTPELRIIRVSLRVQGEFQNVFLHNGQYFVPEGATLEDVMIKAQEEGHFMFGTQTTLSGSFLTSVMGISPRERQYWQLLRAPDTPLQQGISDYKPQDGETILLRLASW
ncbi:transcobalamin-2 [Gracilinanus agilis]|uniref:transcobalamin-2 n=1 Tax=Gracilinanus agilis TaxID=191870 RepID=UPI001CFC5D69|nr:transcobalamin-2 [Gracilinanus agilis]XP_044530190.1 transcobalamin-2 [Gracilinanus agilis]